jgi:hypothetical protein
MSAVVAVLMGSLGFLALLAVIFRAQRPWKGSDGWFRPRGGDWQI